MFLKMIFILVFMALLTFIGPHSAKAQTTSGDCSPVIIRTGGDVTLICGQNDLEANFLIAIIREECSAFSAQMQSAGERISESDYSANWFQPPRFTDGIVKDFRSQSAILNDYDPEGFISIYRTAINLAELYKDALRARDNYSSRIDWQSKRYLRSVEVVCQWVGVSLNVGEWIAKYDIDQFLILPPAKRLPEFQKIGLFLPENRLNNNLIFEQLVKGAWCSANTKRFIRFFSLTDGNIIVEYGDIKLNRFIPTNVANAPLIKLDASSLRLILDDSSGRGIVRFGENFKYFVLDLSIFESTLVYNSLRVVSLDTSKANENRVHRSPLHRKNRTYARCEQILYSSPK